MAKQIESTEKKEKERTLEEACLNQECIDYCYLYESAGDQCWWSGCDYTDICN